MNKTLTALVLTSLSLATLVSSADEKGKKKPATLKKEQLAGKLRPHMVKFDKNKEKTDPERVINKRTIKEEKRNLAQNLKQSKL